VTLRFAVALNSDSFDATAWVSAARQADEARLDFLTFDDAFGRRGPDAVLVASRVAPVTRHVGLVPVATTTHTEPFHLSTALATLDHVSHGRAGWQVRVSADPAEAALLGRRAPLGSDDLFAEASDAVDVVRRLWDSWEDDAEIRDTATGRFIDRDKLHYVDFESPHFSVKGPSITPRPPQGQPIVTALAHATAKTVRAPKPITRAEDSQSMGEILPSFHLDTARAITVATMKAPVLLVTATISPTPSWPSPGRDRR
jgi:alkanesulfonate monooxygenase SsuD/methylene tetrahydromethanopterin reductase-like flavin-dependent oxidoreductase (luciferase family)